MNAYFARYATTSGLVRLNLKAITIAVKYGEGVYLYDYDGQSMIH